MKTRIYAAPAVKGLNKTNMSNFYPFNAVGRGSETQVQVGENLKKENLEGKGLVYSSE